MLCYAMFGSARPLLYTRDVMQRQFHAKNNLCRSAITLLPACFPACLGRGKKRNKCMNARGKLFVSARCFEEEGGAV